MVRKRPAAKAVKAESEQEEQNASEEVKEQDEGDQGFEEPVQQAEQPEGRPSMAQKKDTMSPKQKVLEVLNRTVDNKLQNLFSERQIVPSAFRMHQMPLSDRLC